MTCKHCNDTFTVHVATVVHGERYSPIYAPCPHCEHPKPSSAEAFKKPTWIDKFKALGFALRRAVPQ